MLIIWGGEEFENKFWICLVWIVCLVLFKFKEIFNFMWSNEFFVNGNVKKRLVKEIFVFCRRRFLINSFVSFWY